MTTTITERAAALVAAFLLLAAVLLDPAALHAQTSPPLRIEAGFTFSGFQQQVKTEVGGIRGERLVDELQLGAGIAGVHRVIDHLALGLFARADFGFREAGRFDGFDSIARTRISNQSGGGYSEVWLGPMARVSWRFVSLQIGYAAVGIRSDDGRTDIASSTGDTTSAFATNPAIAWLFALGADVPLEENLALVLTLEYRARYYSSRGGASLAGDIEHGTQSLAPLIGIAWSL